MMILIIFGMQFVAIKLESLQAWFDQHFQDISNCLANYPYNHFRSANAVSSFKIRINQIIDFILDQLQQNSYHVRRDFLKYASRPALTLTDITFLSQIKSELEDIRYSLLAISDKKYNSVDRIKSKLRHLITLTSSSKRISSYDITKNIQNDKSHSKSITKRREDHYRPKSPAMREYASYEMFRNKESEQEKAARIKKQLHQQMSNQIKMNHDLIVDRQRNRIFSDSQERFGRKLSNRLNRDVYQRQIRQPKQFRKGQQPKDNYNPQKKRYNYLQKYQNSQKNVQKRPPFQLDTIYKDTYNSLPSTQTKSENKIQDFDPLGEQIDQISKQINLREVKQKLDFEALLKNDSKVQQDQMQDSIEEGRSNLSEDSLELMKKQERLNQTGCFVIPQPSPEQPQHLEYSFCRE